MIICILSKSGLLFGDIRASLNLLLLVLQNECFEA